MKKALSITGLAFLLLVFSGCNFTFTAPAPQKPNPSTSQTLAWQELLKGLAYSNLQISNKELFLVKIDPAQYQFKVYQNPDEKNAKSIKQIHQEQKSLVTFNGSFFDENFKALGLLVDGGKQLHEQSPSELMNGIFSISQNYTPSVSFKQKFTLNPDINFAIENGPILIDEKGVIQTKKDTGKTAARTALGLDNQNNILLIVLQQNLLQSDNTLSLYEFAHLLREASALKGLDIHSVLNLDGGKSTGLMIDNHYFPEVNSVQNVIMVSPLP